MSDKFLITFYASQSNLSDKDEMTFTAPGEFYEENGIKIVKYKEYSEDSHTKDDYSLNTIKIISDNKVSILREGDHITRLFLEKDKLHKCHYRTKMGDLMFDVFCNKINNNLTNNGGKLEVAYSLDLNGETVSYNRFILTVKEN